MSNLGPQKINLSYDGLLQVPGGITASLQTVTDGNGNSSGLQISSTGISGQITSNGVVITGGSINGTPIGATTASTGRFTNLTATGTTTLDTALTGILKGTSGVVGLASAGTDYVSPSVLGAANGVATLGSDSKLTASQVPNIAIVEYLGTVNSQAAMLALTGQQGDWCIRSDLGTTWVITGSNPAVIGSWTQLSYPTAPVTSVNTLTGAVSLSYTNVGAAPATTGSSILYANGSGGFSNVTVGSGLSFVGGTLTSSAAGTVTTVSVATANGLAGTVANASSTPAITLKTTVSGVLKGNGTAISAAVSGTDYAPATTGTSILKGDNAGGFAAAVSNTDYQAVITATGLLKGAGAGSISAAVVGTDYAPATTGTSILKGNGSGGFSSAVSGTDYAPATSGTSLLKGNGLGGFSNATSGTDYAPATSGSSILYGNSSGGFSNVTVGSGLSFSAGTLASTAGGGSVTTVSVVSANGFAGTVANASSTPAITLTTSVTGLLKGNGTAISAAVAGTDYAGLASANTFANNQVISVSSASDALRITQTGAGNALLVEDSANPDATPFVIDSAGRAIIGYTVSQTFGGLTSIPLQISGTSQGASSFATSNWAASTTPTTHFFSKSRGPTVGTHAVLNINDQIGLLQFEGSDGTAFIPAASISTYVDGTPGTNDMPGRLVFSTTADGASGPTERMRIDNAGSVVIGGSLATAGQSFRVRKNITGAVNSSGIVSQATIQSDVTSGGVMFSSYPSTVDAAFTLASLIHYDADQGTITGGSRTAPTSQFGFRVTSSLTGATNNYGFYSNIASGTGRWGFYAAGSAANYFSGNTTIAGTTTLNSSLNGLAKLTSGVVSSTTATLPVTTRAGATVSVNLNLS